MVQNSEEGTSFALLLGDLKSPRATWLAVQDALSECKGHGNGSGATVLYFRWAAKPSRSLRNKATRLKPDFLTE